jgi:hypothetical protein
MTLEQATNTLTKAIEARDFDALERALVARQGAIQCGTAPTLEIVEAGERAMRALAAWKQRLASENVRLGQVRSYLLQPQG